MAAVKLSSRILISGASSTILAILIMGVFQVEWNHDLRIQNEIQTSLIEAESLIFSNDKASPDEAQFRQIYFRFLQKGYRLSICDGEASVIMPERMAGEVYPELLNIAPGYKGYELKKVNGSHILYIYGRLNEQLYSVAEKNITRLVHERQREYLRLGLISILACTVSLAMLLLLSRNIGKNINYILKGIKDVESSRSGPVVIDGGITEFTILSERFNEMSEQIRNRLERQDGFIRSITHELKTPLTGIIGFAELIELYGDDTEKIIEWSRTIGREGQRLLAVSTQLRDYIILDKPPAQRTVVACSDLLSRVDKIMKEKTARKKITLKLNCGKTEISVYPELLVTALVNLVSNAVNACGEGKCIELGCRIVESTIRFWVTDNGPGIPESERGRITEPFYQVDKSRSSSGLGLGLTVVEKIARLHKGKMKIEEGVDGGTSVILILERLHD